MMRLVFLGIAALVLATGGQSQAGPIVAVDENGNGSITYPPPLAVKLPLIFFGLTPDPGPGGQPLVMTYGLPFAGVAGDVYLLDNGVKLDVLRFDGNSKLYFYSDNVDGVDDLADTTNAPGPVANIARVIEGNLYTPGANDPGFDVQQPTYNFQSDVEVPEPASLTMFGLGMLGAGGYAWRKRRRAA